MRYKSCAFLFFIKKDIFVKKERIKFKQEKTSVIYVNTPLLEDSKKTKLELADHLILKSLSNVNLIASFFNTRKSRTP
jgi:hypothetical protein